MNEHEQAWLVVPRPNPDAAARLFCFPYAGGGASMFRGWARRLPPEVEVCAIQLPGRENRFRETPARRLEPLVEGVLPAVAARLDRPFAFYGHSLGALVAFELARALRRRGSRLPERLFVSGSSAPHLPDRNPPLHHLTDAELIEQVLAMNGSPREVLEHPEYVGLVLPPLRADFEVGETYRHREEPPLALSIVAFAGRSDPRVEVEEMEAWAQHATGGARTHVLPGDHFFLRSRQDEFLALFGTELERWIETPGT